MNDSMNFFARNAKENRKLKFEDYMIMVKTGTNLFVLTKQIAVPKTVSIQAAAPDIGKSFTI